MDQSGSNKFPPQPKVALIGIPYDDNSSFLRGAAAAPQLIREALFSSAANLWSESGIDLDSPLCFDAGDIEPAASASGELGKPAGNVSADQNREMFWRIEQSIGELLERGLWPIALGGDHSITYPIIKAFRHKYSALSLLHFDAHPDLYDEFQGNRYSHACPFARIMEEKLVGRLVQVGVRTMNDQQRRQAARFGVEVIEMKDWRDDLAFAFDSPVYVSFDLDGLDPAFAPGVAHREPGGLSTRQAIDVIRRIRGAVVGADVVEFNPRQDPLNLTAVVCAKLVKELAARMLTGGGSC